MHFMFDWETEADHISFDDSDRFEEDSLCSWNSEPESLCNNWRGWKRQNGGQAFPAQQQQQQRTTGNFSRINLITSRLFSNLTTVISLHYGDAQISEADRILVYEGLVTFMYDCGDPIVVVESKAHVFEHHRCQGA
uniref:Uncharacterized protein n=1 Tax=Octopus bimaculoides TaxID=37653 RepID=A0A0L8G974_OCTBM